LGLGTTTADGVSTPTKVAISNIKEISAGGFHSLILDFNGTIYAVGQNSVIPFF
jgi:alpha-tubulin suppressor-like RCC1 family protein